MSPLFLQISPPWSGWFYVFGPLLFLTSLFLILLVLVQRGKGGGLTGALGGMGGQSAFGTKAGDVFTRVTMVTATLWILMCIAAIKTLSPPPPRPTDSQESSITVPGGDAKKDDGGKEDKAKDDKGKVDEAKEDEAKTDVKKGDAVEKEKDDDGKSKDKSDTDSTTDAKESDDPDGGGKSDKGKS